MTNIPLVSIIIPTYNRAHLIGETLDSVLEQTYTHWECFVIDDGSTDKTVEVLSRYLEQDARFQYHCRPKDRPKGANACRNYGFEVSKGDYILFLDSDDILEPFCLMERVQLITADLRVNLLIRDSSRFIEDKHVKETINLDPKIISADAYLEMFLRYEVPWQTMGAFYKRELLQTIKFDESLQRFQDVSFNIKVLSVYKPLHILRDFKMDTRFRVDVNKLQIKNHLNLVFESLIKFNNLHKNLLKNERLRHCLQQFNYHFFSNYLIVYYHSNKQISNWVLISSVKSNLFSLKQRIVVAGLLFYLITGLLFKKGYGVYRFMKIFNQVFIYK